jgi:hypothetical protein
MEEAKGLSHGHTTTNLGFYDIFMIEFSIILDIRQIWLQSKQTSDLGFKCDWMFSD